MKDSRRTQIEHFTAWKHVLASAASQLPVAPSASNRPLPEVQPQHIAACYGLKLVPIHGDEKVPLGVPVISLSRTGHPTLDGRIETEAHWAVMPLPGSSSLEALPRWLARQWVHSVGGVILAGAGAIAMTIISIVLIAREQHATATAMLIVLSLVGAGICGYLAQAARRRIARWVDVLQWFIGASLRNYRRPYPPNERSSQSHVERDMVLANEYVPSMARIVALRLAFLASVLISASVIVTFIAPVMTPLLIAIPMLGIGMPAIVSKRIMRLFLAGNAAEARAHNHMKCLLRERINEPADPLATRHEADSVLHDSAEALAQHDLARRSAMPSTLVSGFLPILSVLAAIWLYRPFQPNDPSTTAMVIIAIGACGAATGAAMESILRAITMIAPAVAVWQHVQDVPSDASRDVGYASWSIQTGVSEAERL